MPSSPASKVEKVPEPLTFIERVIASIGSVQSLLIHTLLFAGAFCISLIGLVEWSFMLLVLTTLLSLEAIYLAIFIQITVNSHTQSLKDVEEDVEDIQEDLEELGEDVEEMQEDLEEISEDIEEISEDIDEIQEDVEELNEEEEGTESKKEEPVKKKKKPEKTDTELLAQLTTDVQRLLVDLEALKKKS